MSDRIVSWRINEPRVSPSLSTVSSASGLSVLSINSIGSDTHMMTEATGAQRVDLGVTKPTNLTSSANPKSDDSFVRHDIYFFKDGNITFLVDGTLYCVHRYFFCRDSAYFSTKLVQLDVRDHQPLNTIISLGDVERKDFEAFLSVIYPENFEEHDLSYEQWRSVLNLSTRWGFGSLRKLALRSIKPPTAFDQLLLARTYNVDHWVLPALSALCKRKRPTSTKEARQMSIEDIVVVATVREEIRSRRPFVDAADIERRIEAAQVKVVTHVDDDDDDDDDDDESEGEEEYVSDTILKEGKSATRPNPVFRGNAFGRHPPGSGQPVGTPIMSRPVTPPTPSGLTPSLRPVMPRGIFVPSSRRSVTPPRPPSRSITPPRPPSRPVTPRGRSITPPRRSVTPPSRPITPVAPIMSQGAATPALGWGSSSKKKSKKTSKTSTPGVSTSGWGVPTGGGSSGWGGL